MSNIFTTLDGILSSTYDELEHLTDRMLDPNSLLFFFHCEVNFLFSDVAKNKYEENENNFLYYLANFTNFPYSFLDEDGYKESLEDLTESEEFLESYAESVSYRYDDPNFEYSKDYIKRLKVFLKSKGINRKIETKWDVDEVAGEYLIEFEKKYCPDIFNPIYQEFISSDYLEHRIRDENTWFCHLYFRPLSENSAKAVCQVVNEAREVEKNYMPDEARKALLELDGIEVTFNGDSYKLLAENFDEKFEAGVKFSLV